MKQSFPILIACWLILFISSCTDHIKNGDEYFAQANEAVHKGQVIKAYSLVEKALEEYRKGKDISRQYKAKIFMSLLYFSTNQKDKAYELIKDTKPTFPEDENYPLYSNYYRLKAFYKATCEKNTGEALSLMDSVIQLDKVYAKGNTTLLNLDRLNKCEVLLDGGDTTQRAKLLIDTVRATTKTPSSIEPQLYANMARLFDATNQPDSAYTYAKLVVDKTSKIHEDIDNNLHALDIILRYDSIKGDLTDYIHYRDMQEKLRDERQGDQLKYGMAFVKQESANAHLRLKDQTEKRTLAWICVSILLVGLIIFLILRQKHKEALIKNEMTQLECDRLDAEAFRRKLENELLLVKINSKSDELLKANNEILELSQQLAQKNEPLSKNDETYLQRLMESLTSNHPGFQQRIAEKYPNITKAETTLACLIKLNLSSEEITTAMSISKSGLIKARYRLRKRLGVESSAELDNYITTF